MYQSKIVEPEKNIGNYVFMISVVELRAVYIHSD